MVHDVRQVIGVRRGRHDKGGPSVFVQRLEVLGPGPAMELDDAVEALDEAGEQEKATASDMGTASGAVDELDDGTFIAVRGEGERN